MRRLQPLILVAALALGACGSTTQDRTISGSGIGAAGGAIVGAVTGLTVLEGAALGALGGALTGALTDERQVNLGEPFWRRGGTTSRGQASDAGPGGPGARAHAHAGSPVVKRIQSGLRDQGYEPGPVDGLMGPRTAAAIRRYQRDNGLLTDGRASVELAQHVAGRTGPGNEVAATPEPAYQ